MTEEKETVEGFYQECADLLGIPSTYVERHPYWRRTRWSNRQPGSGRFPGYGTIRMFSSELIHVALNHPVSVNQVFTSKDAVIEFLKKTVDSSQLQL